MYSYNDEDLPMLGGDEVLCPYDKFIDRLKEMALDDDQHSALCAAGATDAETLRVMEGEIKATTMGYTGLK